MSDNSLQVLKDKGDCVRGELEREENGVDVE